MKERMRPETELEQDAKQTKGERGRRALWDCFGIVYSPLLSPDV